MFNISVILRDTNKVDHILVNMLYVQFYFDALNVIDQFSKIKDDISVISQFSWLYLPKYRLSSYHWRIKMSSFIMDQLLLAFFHDQLIIYVNFSKSFLVLCMIKNQMFLLTLFMLGGGGGQFVPPPVVFFYITQKVLVWGCWNFLTFPTYPKPSI